MRTFTQKELNQFIINHINNVCENYENATIKKDDYNADYYFAQIMAFNNVATVFADSETYLEVNKRVRKALKFEED